MCEAIEAMVKDSRTEGEQKGKFEAFVGLVKDGLLSVKDAAARLNMTEEQFRDAMKKA